MYVVIIWRRMILPRSFSLASRTRKCLWCLLPVLGSTLFVWPLTGLSCSCRSQGCPSRICPWAWSSRRWSTSCSIRSARCCCPEPHCRTLPPCCSSRPRSCLCSSSSRWLPCAECVRPERLPCRGWLCCRRPSCRWGGSVWGSWCGSWLSSGWSCRPRAGWSAVFIGGRAPADTGAGPGGIFWSCIYDFLLL